MHQKDTSAATLLYIFTTLQFTITEITVQHIMQITLQQLQIAKLYLRMFSEVNWNS